MAESGKRGVPRRIGLSARLLILTSFFVMLSEVLIYAPSIGRFRLDYMQERIAMAHLASLALEVPPDNLVNRKLREALLIHAQSHGIVLRRPESKALILAKDMPPMVDAMHDLRQGGFFGPIGEALMVFTHKPGRFLRVIAPSPQDASVTVETVIEEDPMRAAMLGYSWRILALSIVISLMTATLVYLSLQWLLVAPMRGLVESMMAFRVDPEDARRVGPPGARGDEIGLAQRALAEMQTELRGALKQRARLAALGTAMAKINHDLRNILATARLVSDTLSVSDDPKVRQSAPRLLSAIDRAVTLCGQTLDFARDSAPPPECCRFGLRALVEEARDDIVPAPRPNSDCDNRPVCDNRIAADFEVVADRDQIFRVLSNLIRNAVEAGATLVRIDAGRSRAEVWIDIADDGPGLPDAARDKLFQPFTGAGRAGGSGLGLAIARDLIRGHGGDIGLVKSDASGTVFRLRLPEDDALGAAASA